jgi:hypothetical protein
MAGVLNVCQAFGLSAASGLNAYIPLLVIGLLARFTNLIHLHQPYDVLTHPVVLIVLAVLAVLDCIGDKIPAVDHVLHLIGLVVHPVAGAILFLAANSDTGTVNPVLAAVCGLVLAGGIHAARATARPVATATTAGLANPLVSFAEDVVALALSILAVVVPVVAALLVLFVVITLVRFVRRRRRRAATRATLGAPRLPAE